MKQDSQNCCRSVVGFPNALRFHLDRNPGGGCSVDGIGGTDGVELAVVEEEFGGRQAG